jgi:integrase
MLADGPRQTVRQFITRWLEDTVRPTLRPRTFETYEGKVRLHVLPELGHLTLAKLNPQHLQRLYATKLAEGLSPTTVNHVHWVIHGALAQAVRFGLVARNVAEVVESPKRPEAEPNPCTEEEVAAFLSAIQGHRHENFWIVLLASGLRFGECAALHWSDVDLRSGVVRVRHTVSRRRGAPLAVAEPKTPRSRRVVPLARIGVEALRDQRIQVQEDRLRTGDRWRLNDLVFPSAIGTPLRETHVLERFHRVREAAGIRWHTMHDLRDTYSTSLAAKGVHPLVAQEMLGHGRIDTTMRIYTAVVPDAMTEKAARLDDVFVRPTRTDKTRHHAG